jgi:hypothetical protein
MRLRARANHLNAIANRCGGEVKLFRSPSSSAAYVLLLWMYKMVNKVSAVVLEVAGRNRIKQSLPVSSRYRSR